MMKISLVIFVIFAISNITRGMRTITSQAGSNININWNIHNKTENVIYIAHNNKTMIVLWAKENYFNPAPEYMDRLDFSFVKQDRELKLNLLLKNISELDEGIYTCYIQLRDEEMETVKLIVTGPLKEPIDISGQQSNSTENQSGPDNINLSPNETTIYEFGALNITCFADCYLSCSFQWIKHSEHAIPKMLVSDSATMEIKNVTRDNAGNYSCMANNTITNKTLSENITLEVIYGPNYVYFNEVQTKNSPTTAQLKTVNCSADCYPPCEYLIIVPGDEIVYSNESLHSVTENGTYTCRAINPATGKSSGTSLLTILYELDHNDSSNNSIKDSKVPDEESPLSDAISAPLLTNILLGTAVILTCFICGFIVYKSRKGFCKPNSIISTTAEIGTPGIDLGINKDFQMVHTDIEPITKYWTIGEDNTGGLHTVIDETGASGHPSLGLRSCTIKQNKPPEDLDEIHLHPDDNTYIHPI